MTPARIKKDLDSLAEQDGQLARALAGYGYPAPRKRPAGFEAFLRIIISQQISTEAARAVYERVQQTLGGPDCMTAERMHRCRVDRLRRAGMSGRKIEYARGLARAIVRGEFDPDALSRMSDQQAIETIVSLRGFGVWSAEIYLMFSLGRRDVFAADDLALRVALQKLKRKRKLPSAKEARALTDHWSPYRSAGCLFLWHYYRGAPQ